MKPDYPTPMSKLERARAFEAAAQWLELKHVQLGTPVDAAIATLNEGVRQLRTEYAQQYASPMSELAVILGDKGTREVKSLYGPDVEGRFWKVDVYEVSDGPRGQRQALALVEETFR